MAFFGLFGKKTGEGAVARHAARVANKRAQAPDRWESIQALGAMRSPSAIAALMPRFTYYADPSITDQEEKDEAFRLIVEAGEVAIDPVVAFMKKAESVTWALKVIERVAPAERIVTELLALLASMDTEYERDPQRKLQILQALEERTDPRIGAAIARFVEDVNETARFHAVGSIVRQADAAEHREALLAQLVREESVRVRTRLFESFAELGWSVAPEREKLAKVLPPGFTLDAQGVPRKR